MVWAEAAAVGTLDHERMRILYPLISFLIVAVAAFPSVGSDGSHLDKAALNGLAEAKDARTLEQRWRDLSAPNAVERIVYATRRMVLAPGETSDAIMVSAIPADSLTFDVLYDLCYMNREGSSDALQVIAGGAWVDPAVDAVIRSGKGYERILMLPFVGAHNADVGETLPCAVSDIQQRAPQAYKRSLRQLPEKARALVCPECC
jgi:hypothetical protein